jgi:hypothetical protein
MRFLAVLAILAGLLAAPHVSAQEPAFRIGQILPPMQLMMCPSLDDAQKQASQSYANGRRPWDYQREKAVVDNCFVSNVRVTPLALEPTIQEHNTWGRV